METYYCDGSQHKELNRLGVGITKDGTDYYYEVDDFDYEMNLHEIEAIKRTAELALRSKRSDGNIIIVNDDRYLVQRIQSIKKNLKIKTGNLKKKQEFRDLVKILKENDIIVRAPANPYDKSQILKCHHLSRTYLSKAE